MKPSAQPLQERFFILPWSQFGDTVGNATELAQDCVARHDHQLRVGTERLSIRRDASATLPTGWVRRPAPGGVEGLPYQPPVFVPEEERQPLDRQALEGLAATLDVLTTVTARASGGDLLEQLVAACGLGAEFNHLALDELAAMLDDQDGLRARRKTVARVRDALAPISRPEAGLPLIRGGTQVAPQRSAALDEQAQATLAALERLERCAECLVRLLTLEREQQARLTPRRI